MTPKEIQVLYRACKSAGIDASKIQPLHQFSLLLCSSQHQLLLQTLGMMDFLGSQKQREQYLAQGNKSQQKSFMIAFVVLNFARQKEILIPSLGETSCRNSENLKTLQAANLDKKFADRKAVKIVDECGQYVLRNSHEALPKFSLLQLNGKHICTRESFKRTIFIEHRSRHL